MIFDPGKDSRLCDSAKGHKFRLRGPSGPPETAGAQDRRYDRSDEDRKIGLAESCSGASEEEARGKSESRCRTHFPDRPAPIGLRPECRERGVAEQQCAAMSRQGACLSSNAKAGNPIGKERIARSGRVRSAERRMISPRGRSSGTQESGGWQRCQPPLSFGAAFPQDFGVPGVGEGAGRGVGGLISVDCDQTTCHWPRRRS
jgi:hypothetical protein